MTRYKRGDVVLLRFPFTDSVGQKRHPAVVVSSDSYMQRTVDLLVAMVTSKSRRLPLVGDYSLKDWRGAGLIGPSVVRARIATVHSKHVIRTLGQISAPDMEGIDRGLRLALNL